MKRFLLWLCAGLLLLSGCTPRAEATGGKPIIYASFFPVWDLAVKAAGGLADVKCLIPPGAEPHDADPSPRDIIALTGSRIFFYSGAGFENWVADALPQLGDGGPPAVATAEEAGVAISGEDPHVWLSPKIAKLQFSVMASTLKEVFPENAAELDANAELWLAEFDRLDEEFRELENLPKKTIFVTHAAFGYLCREYGITSVSPLGYTPNVEADPSALARVIEAARKDGATVIFYDKPENLQLAETIAAEADAKVLRLHPLESPSDEELAAGADYFALMRENLAALKEALS